MLERRTQRVNMNDIQRLHGTLMESCSCVFGNVSTSQLKWMHNNRKSTLLVKIAESLLEISHIILKLNRSMPTYRLVRTLRFGSKVRPRNDQRKWSALLLLPSGG